MTKQIPTFHSLVTNAKHLTQVVDSIKETTFHSPKHSKYRRLSLEQWKAECAVVHNNKYDYTYAVEVVKDPIMHIVCPEHGDFYQTKHGHLVGQGCPTCGRLKRTLAEEDVIERLAKNNPTVIYVSGYKTSRLPAVFRSTTCSHVWSTAPNTVMYYGSKCPICTKSVPEKTRHRDTTEQFKKKLSIKRDGLFTLVSEYTGSLMKASFKCTTCGEVFQCTPNRVLSGNKGCPACKTR